MGRVDLIKQRIMTQPWKSAARARAHGAKNRPELMGVDVTLFGEHLGVGELPQ